MKKFLSLALTLAMVLSLSMPAFAVTFDPATELAPGTVYVSRGHLTPEEQAMLDTVADMSVDELRTFINEKISELKNANPNSRITTLELQLLWVAAAQLAKGSGYPLAGTLIENSVWNNDYDEYNGAFSTAIKGTTAYRAWCRNMSVPSIAFERSDNSDLFFSLHLANIRLGSSSSQGAVIQVTDVFDFAFVTDMGNIFVTLVNDWAWLCQQTHVLHPINVRIQFNG